MRDFLCAIVSLIGTVLLVGGCLFYGNLFGASGAAMQLLDGADQSLETRQ